MKKQLLLFTLLGSFSLASGYEIIIDSTYYIEGRDDTKEVVYDSKTALMWQDDSNAKTVTKCWQGAIEYCQNLSFAGYNDWRLPNKEELKTIVDTSRRPTIKPEFKNALSYVYWSSTPSADYSIYAWSVTFDGGYEGYNLKGDNRYVRCVRDSK